MADGPKVWGFRKLQRARVGPQGLLGNAHWTEKPLFFPFIFGMMLKPVRHTVFMSIDRLHHLRFPIDLGPVARSTEPVPVDPTGLGTVADSEAPEGKADGAKAAAPRLTARVPTLLERIEPPQVSVVVNIQADAQTRAAEAAPVVYGNTRKVAAPANNEVDLAAMEAAHQRALERSANAVTALKVDADGIVVARQPDFVSVAVSAMREFKDEAERQKRYAQASLAATPAPIATESGNASASPLRGLQQLASRLNLFA